MTLPRGLEHFTEYFKDHENDYVIIGGGAAAAYLEDEGLEFRATQDIDMVLFTSNSKELNAKITDYIYLGEYELNERTEGTPRYYRFTKPQKDEFPKIVEIFSRNENEIELKDKQYIIPIQNDEDSQLSAILLDEEYFELIKSNAVKTEKGFSVINPYVNICLKARAFRELQERGEEKNKISKHKKDVLRLVQALGGKQLPLSGKPKEDFLKVVEAITEMPEKEIKQVIGDILSKKEILGILERSFDTK
jgi:hypothetical protein